MKTFMPHFTVYKQGKARPVQIHSLMNAHRINVLCTLYILIRIIQKSFGMLNPYDYFI